MRHLPNFPVGRAVSVPSVSGAATTYEVELGCVADFARLPARLEIADAAYFLVRAGDTGWRLLAAVCPHMGGTIEDLGGVFRCPNHVWTFDRSTGAPAFPALHAMSAYDVEEREGVLVAHVAEGGWDGVRARQRAEARHRRAR